MPARLARVMLGEQILAGAAIVLWRSAMPSDNPVPPGPLRRFADRLDEIRSAEVFNIDQVGRALTELAADEEFFEPLIAQLPSGSPGNRWLIRPDRGPGWSSSTVRKES
jgi:hypothetical protein